MSSKLAPALGKPAVKLGSRALTPDGQFSRGLSGSLEATAFNRVNASIRILWSRPGKRAGALPGAPACATPGMPSHGGRFTLRPVKFLAGCQLLVQS
jgi:hypothetical protein